MEGIVKIILRIESYTILLKIIERRPCIRPPAPAAVEALSIENHRSLSSQVRRDISTTVASCDEL
jgi:hypothetical protein